ncbi:hypothetical protein BDP27DRAFT_1418290 [Rhodocollybia butyracea]|uniref:Uncharacterized protein n=1 Tax=Rhodocollybia butyracea TaxID=206335 RepID=A0A9P5PZQ6_9AGAR|nr:hypothetical protein BDP27DRAFT_1418290 [Rhodocollybia butyracea]
MATPSPADEDDPGPNNNDPTKENFDPKSLISVKKKTSKTTGTGNTRKPSRKSTTAKPRKKTNKAKDPGPEPALEKPEKKPRAIFSTEDDRIMVAVLLDQKEEGNTTDNGGWKEPALKCSPLNDPFIRGRLQRTPTNHKSGELEQTISHSFYKGATFRQSDDEDWDEDEGFTDDESLTSPGRRPETDGDKVLSTPPPVELTRVAGTHDIQCFSQVAASRGFFNTPSAIAQGNSYIAYKPEGNLKADWVPGRIQHIFSLHSKKKLAIWCSKSSSHHAGDTFARFQNLGFEAKLVSQSFIDKLEIINIEWVVGHTARWNLCPGLAVVLSLGQVRYSFSVLLHH